MAALDTNAMAEIPPLEAGDYLSRAEFERRYEAMPHLKKAELIERIVYIQPRVKIEHGTATAALAGWLGTYSIATPGVTAALNVTVRMDWDNEPQPDVILRIDPECGGQSGTEDDFVTGAPDLVAEAVATGASYDLHQKMHVYRRNGVREYVVWVVREVRLEWWELREGEYVSLHVEQGGVIKSRVFPGLWLNARSLLEGDHGKTLDSVREGTQSPEHAAFVEELERRRSA